MYYDTNGNLRTSKMEYVKALFCLLIGILSICYMAGFMIVMCMIFAM